MDFSMEAAQIQNAKLDTTLKQFDTFFLYLCSCRDSRPMQPKMDLHSHMQI